METIRLHPAERPIAGPIAGAPLQVPADVDGFLDALRHEHQRFLSAVGAATSQLTVEHVELAAAVAVHGRLTRQFLDAQRSILQRRAEVTAEVGRIEREAASNSSALVAMAQRRATAMSQHPAGQRLQRSTAVAEPSHSSVDLWNGCSPVVGATSPDVAALVGEIDEVFETREPLGVAAQRQLAELLECWWNAEQQEASAALDDANARAAVRRHVAVVEASAVVDDQHEAEGSGASGLLPRNVTAVLDLAVAADLDHVLTALIASLQTPPEVVHAAMPVTVPVIEAALAEPPLAEGAILRFEAMPAAAADEAFQQFWAKQPVAPLPTRRMRWWPTASLMVPITLLSSLAVLAAAWVG